MLQIEKEKKTCKKNKVGSLTVLDLKPCDKATVTQCSAERESNRPIDTKTQCRNKPHKHGHLILLFGLGGTRGLSPGPCACQVVIPLLGYLHCPSHSETESH